MKKIIQMMVVIGILVSLCGCQDAKQADDAAFNELTKGWFAEDCSADYLTMRLSVSDPSAYGITAPTPSLGDPTDRDVSQLKDRLSKLQAYDVSKLSRHQKVTYDTLLANYQLSIADLSSTTEYGFAFTPNGGLNNNLITTLSEIKLRDEQDVKDFITLLHDVPRYIDLGIANLLAMADDGIIQPDAVQDQVIAQCQKFIAKTDDNTIVVTFASRIATLNIADSQSYQDQVAKAVVDEVIPAYQKIIATYNGKLRGKATGSGAICSFDGGKDYYKNIMFPLLTGYGTDPAAVAQQLWKKIDELQNDVMTLAQKDPAAYYTYFGIDYDATVKAKSKDSSSQYVYLSNAKNIFGMSDPDTIIAAYREALKNNFPTGPDDKVTVSALDTSVATDGIAAYYVNAPVDDYISDNVIRYNASYSNSDPDYLCSVLAHEGFPGHCYQITYYLDHFKDDVIRNNVTTLGYTEGWAMYAEQYAYNYLSTDKDIVSMYQMQLEMEYYMYAAMDIEVNYNGADTAQVAKLLTEHYYTNYEATDPDILSMADSFATQLIGDPATFTYYGVGLMAMNDLCATAQDKLGNKFDIKKFHQAVLDAGTTDFATLSAYVAETLGYTA